jgi:AcrR family transcriptional regulator
VSPPRKPKQKNQKKRYHHGDLRRSLIETSLDLIEKDGVGALTLREVARRLGVSHAAPKYHFADKGALLAVLAAQGFSALADAMTTAAEQVGADPMRRLNATGVAYVACAVRQPQQFRLMFGSDIPDTNDDADLLRESARAFSVLTDAVNDVMASRGERDPHQIPVYVATAWSIVHGLATLWLDERLAFVQEQFPTAESLALAVTDLLYKLFKKE